jgi:hypothetical protein
MEDIATLRDKDAIRELALLYCRGVDRKDPELLRELYADGATDTHGNDFDGSAQDFVAFLEKSFPIMPYSGHHVCNHLISLDGDTAEGEVYALAYHILQGEKPDEWVEHFLSVRYLDHYQRESDGKWRFASRVVHYDIQRIGPCEPPLHQLDAIDDPSFNVLASRLFARGPRA